MAGTGGIQTPLIVKYTMTSGATDNYVMTRPGIVADAWVIAIATSNNGTMTVSKAGAAIFDAMVCADAGALIRAATAYSLTNATLEAGNSLRFAAAGDVVATTTGRVHVLILPTLAAQQTVA